MRCGFLPQLLRRLRPRPGRSTHRPTRSNRTLPGWHRQLQPTPQRNLLRPRWRRRVSLTVRRAHPAPPQRGHLGADRALPQRHPQSAHERFRKVTGQTPAMAGAAPGEPHHPPRAHPRRVDPVLMTAALTDELSRTTPTNACCRRAETIILLRFAGAVHQHRGHSSKPYPPDFSRVLPLPLLADSGQNSHRRDSSPRPRSVITRRSVHHPMLTERATPGGSDGALLRQGVPAVFTQTGGDTSSALRKTDSDG